MGKISVQRNQDDMAEWEHVSPEDNQVLTFNFQVTGNTRDKRANETASGEFQKVGDETGQ